MNQTVDLEEDRGASTVPSPASRRWFGRGIYGSKDIPIRLLDGLIAVFILVIVIMVVYFAVHGGYRIEFDTYGGSEIPVQMLRYGELVTEPEIPLRPGYVFLNWYQEEIDGDSWDFSLQKVSGDMTLTASWKPAEILVKFDLDGGSGTDGGDFLSPITAVYGEKYGELPIPFKEDASFAGWVYSGSLIAEDTLVTMNGEHVLRALWEEWRE